MQHANRTLPRVLRAAIGLAARHFPVGIHEGGRRTVTRGSVLFVLDGHVTGWSEWSRLPLEEAQQIARLLRRRPNIMANSEAAGRALDRLLNELTQHGCTAGDGYQGDMHDTIDVDPGMPLSDFIDRALTELDALHSRASRSLPIAKPGPHATTLRVPGAGGTSHTYVDYRYDIQPHHRPPRQPRTALQPRPALLEQPIPLTELCRIADRIDREAERRGESAYRLKAVHRFMAEVRTRAGERIEEMRLTAGNLNQLLAYTGFGKSVVLVETLACWVAEQGITTAFVLPTNANVVRAAHQIERALLLFNHSARVVPLVSPRSLIKVAETSADRASAPGPDADWIWGRFGYGCALSAVAVSESGIDGWQPGREPCGKLRRPNARGRDRTVSCPWRTSCGRYRPARQACTADIIVTSHVNFLVGVLQTPVEDGFGENDRLSVEELVLRRCQLVVIDEVDTFQRSVIERAGRGLMLDQGGHTNTPLRQFDQDFGAAFGRLHGEVDASVRDAYFGLRYLSENYVSHLKYERLGAAAPSRGKRARGPRRIWIVPRRWDGWLASKLFGKERHEVTREDVLKFRSLFPDEVRPQAAEPAEFSEIRHHLAQVVTVGSGGQAIDAAHAALTRLVPSLNERDRGRFISRMLRRVMLERIRRYLHVLMASNAQLMDVGVESAHEIADALGTYGRWQLTPTGPLDRLVFAFTEYHDDTGTAPARLSTAAFGGDPHTYTVGLGDTTALALAGTRRIVLGLSATSYFPGAPHHHVHIKPRWWVADNTPSRVRVESAPVLDASDNAIRISGLDGHNRASATQRLAEGLWRQHLCTELERLHRDCKDRARVLLATTSYEAARLVAEGLFSAGVSSSRICLAVRPGAGRQGDVVANGSWHELSADRLEEFPALTGADILIAPLARVQRGVNIIGAEDKSALGSVWLIVRPIPLIDEPAELVAHIQAKALTDHPGPSSDPLQLLESRRSSAGRYLEDIIRRPPYFQAQPDEVKLGVVAEIINGAVQLIGRARRGGTSAVLHLVDGAMLDPSGGSDIATLIVKLREQWRRTGVLDDLLAYYGTTLEAFFDYADRHATGGSPC